MVSGTVFERFRCVHANAQAIENIVALLATAKGRAISAAPASRGLTNETVNGFVVAEADGSAERAAAPGSTDVAAEKTAGKIATTPVAKRFKNK
jgi:hypothetical protein